MDTAAEWLLADGQGGFASGTASGERTRRYHALLLVAATPPTGRVVLVNGMEAWLDTPAGPVALSTQRYAPDVVHPSLDGVLAEFRPDPWPSWRFRLPGGGAVRLEIGVGNAGTVLRWQAEDAGPCRLNVRLLLSGRDYHALHHENPVFDFAARQRPGAVTWRPYAGLPSVTATGGFAYEHAPQWYRQFLYTAERDRGLDCVEDLASPGILHWALADGPALLRLTAAADAAPPAMPQAPAQPPLRRAADQYLAARAAGRTVIAGFPWFTDWGRDTFIAMRGLLLGAGRLAEAGAILHEWAGAVSRGMLPNRFPDQGEAPEYNAVDASLWFVVAASEYLAAAGSSAALQAAMEEVLSGYAAGTRFGIGADADGLLRAGAPGVALTWMDARLGDWVVTPRIGKPVEIQALWINALHIGAAWSPRWAALARQAQAAFLHRFPDPATGGLADVVDAGFVPGAVDASLRPNQIFAVGGLPLALLDGPAARAVVDLVEARLLTPLGLRTLAPDDPAYIGRYAGGPAARDGAYHQGTAWPWLLGPFVEAWLRVRGDTAAARAQARARFLPPLRAHLDTAGLGHVSEVVDGDAPHRPGGCPFQAWSLGEYLRIIAMTGAEDV